ncbi:hypothetical protein H2200_005421 [Cladophialophora chaetospira]|uniref:Uncharacterized protein n=1 Tax=Cladophialophora chaetospira TaxID=386627 RepID=A0AA38XC20_9EURO|nr:hypothetical protein H2200_005421 [Cladophialophora chaetospira]
MPSRVEDFQDGAAESNPMLAKLGQPEFDPVDFLNDTLPTLNLSSQNQTSKTSRSTQIQGAATESLALLSSLNTVNIRSSSELTVLTDEIIRSGNRLAYEVEVLRGDVNGFHETLTEALRDDIAQFVKEEVNGRESLSLHPDADADEVVETSAQKDEPDFMARLRLLGKVKARLESVITVFGEAMKWPVPPSEVSGASLISVSAPELGIQNTPDDDKAQAVLKQIRAEVNALMGSETEAYAGLEAASQVVEQYRQLATLWKGTSEEKARLKFVDSLIRLVEDRRRVLDAREASLNRRSDSSARSSSALGRHPKGTNESGGATGLFRNLQRLKDDLYLD